MYMYLINSLVFTLQEEYERSIHLLSNWVICFVIVVNHKSVLFVSNVWDKEGMMSVDLAVWKDSFDENIGEQSINCCLLHVIPNAKKEYT